MAKSPTFKRSRASAFCRDLIFRKMRKRFWKAFELSYFTHDSPPNRDPRRWEMPSHHGATSLALTFSVYMEMAVNTAFIVEDLFRDTTIFNGGDVCFKIKRFLKPD